MIVDPMTPSAELLEDWNANLEPGKTYTFDPMHFPHPLMPLTQSTMGPSFATGATKGFKEAGLPIDRITVIHRNHYRYEHWGMVQPASGEEAQVMGQATEARMQREIGRMMERWHGEHLPAILEHQRTLRGLEVAAAPPAEISGLLDQTLAIQEDLWRIHFLIVSPMMLSMQLFDELHNELLGGPDSAGHAMLVGGLSESVKAGIGLSDLAASARELGLDQLIIDSALESLQEELSNTQAGQVFLLRLREYLDVYGLRQDLFELATPTWLENPSVALANVRNYLISGHDARAEQEAKSRSAEQALTAARERLAAFPEAVRGQFEAMVQFGRQGAFLQEEHNFYIDQQGTALLRLFYLRVGDRLVDLGLLDSADDIFYLKLEDLHAVLANLEDTSAPLRVRNLVQVHRAEVAQAATLTPPPFIGEAPAGPPPMSNPMERGMVRFFGGPPQEAPAAGQLKGNPGSKGVAGGIARVARSLDEATLLQPGEVLIAVTTMPAWTPLFGVAAAVVTETGGALSHCAIVAREYGIPAVVGAHGATSAITTGMHVTVDGGTGVVTIAE